MTELLWKRAFRKYSEKGVLTVLRWVSGIRRSKLLVDAQE